MRMTLHRWVINRTMLHSLGEELDTPAPLAGDGYYLVPARAATDNALHQIDLRDYPIRIACIKQLVEPFDRIRFDFGSASLTGPFDYLGFMLVNPRGEVIASAIDVGSVGDGNRLSITGFEISWE